MPDNSWIGFVKDVGVPVTICFYLLYRYEKKMEKISDLLQTIAISLAVIESVLSIDEKKGPR